MFRNPGVKSAHVKVFFLKSNTKFIPTEINDFTEVIYV